MRKRILIALLLVILAGTGLAAYRYWYIPVLRTQQNATVSDAILYPSQGSKLIYNVIYQGNAANAEISDETGHGISDLDALQTLLGSADAPEAVFSGEKSSRALGKAVTADIRTDLFGNIRSLTITDVRDRPCIGIAWKTPTVGGELVSIAQVLERNGAIALYLPMVLDETGGAAALAQVDGVLFPGGEDWNPAAYGETPSPHGANNWNDLRDMSDLGLMKAALNRDIPLLAICRGMQGMNIALGGGLIQDIPTWLGDQIASGNLPQDQVTRILSGTLPGNTAAESCGCGENHLRVEMNGMDHNLSAAHHHLPEGICPDSKWLYPMFGSTSLESVATAHHQAIAPDRLGQGLTIAARSADGIIEAVEYRQNRFALGLQWHPEKDAVLAPRSAGIDHHSGNIPLRALILAAGE